ncbi:hypothetical protein RC15_02780 [Campylobacter jejuni]|nr:hypothetical protein RC38_02485 [Campylobacter jejuni]ALW02920.1 hypothetical protein RC15_02780 [Campylobacter jejuni]
MASCANAKLNSEIKTYDEANKNLKARPVASVYTPQARINTTINTSETSTINISDSGPHTIIIEAGGTLGSIGNNDRIIYAHANGSNTLTLTNLTNKGTINGNVNVEHDNNLMEPSLSIPLKIQVKLMVKFIWEFGVVIQELLTLVNLTIVEP